MSSMVKIAKKVCGSHGHNIAVLVTRGVDSKICTKCGMSLEEIRGVKPQVVKQAA